MGGWAGWLVGWLVACLVGKLVGWLAGWVGWLVARLVDCLFVWFLFDGIIFGVHRVGCLLSEFGFKLPVAGVQLAEELLFCRSR